MDEPRALNHVAEFHRTFDLPIEQTPVIPDPGRCELRLNLLTEELNELRQAIDKRDLVEIADAFCDLQYVLSGAILEFGLGDYFNTLFNEVQRSNMSKVCSTREEAEETLRHYAETKQVEGFIVEKDDHFIVYRNTDGKVLKSVKYSPADIQGLLNGHSR